jgi:hypothetical protein
MIGSETFIIVHFRCSENSIVSFSYSDLLRIEFPQFRHVHDRAVENFALGQPDSLLQDFYCASRVDEFDTSLARHAPPP